MIDNLLGNAWIQYSLGFVVGWILVIGALGVLLVSRKAEEAYRIKSVVASGVGALAAMGGLIVVKGELFGAEFLVGLGISTALGLVAVVWQLYQVRRSRSIERNHT